MGRLIVFEGSSWQKGGIEKNPQMKFEIWV